MKPVRREDGRMVLNIDNEKDLRTYMQPQRLSILFELESRPEGMTAKQLADALGIAPSSAGHHLGKLEQLGLVELARTENIHGFTAKFYKAADVTVSINTVRGEKGLLNSVLMQNILARQLGHVTDLGALMAQGKLEKVPGSAGMNYGTIYLTQQEAAQWMELLNGFVNEHRAPREGTQAYEYTVLMSNLTLWQQHCGGRQARGESAAGDGQNAARA